MGARRIAFDTEAREAIARGVEKLARAVKVTLGPRGRNVILEQAFGSPKVTKDGVTVAKDIELEDELEQIGARIVKEVATKTSDTAGDGTTTATVLAEAIFSEGLRALAAGVTPIAMKRGIDAAVAAVTKALKDMAIEVRSSDDIKAIATISANNDAEMGGIVAEAMEKVGRDGVITVESSPSAETFVDIIEGVQLDRGYLSPHFATDKEALVVELDEPFILITDKKISSYADLVPTLETVAEVSGSLLVIAEDVEGEALATLVLNAMRGVLKVAAIKAPSFGDHRKALLQDLAVLTGGKVLTEDTGMKLDQAEVTDLGRARRVTIDKEMTLIAEGAGTEADITARIDQLRAEIGQTTSSYDREKLEERLGKLSGGVAKICVGGHTEAEVTERKARVEDAIQATRAAVEEGIIVGGGVALLRASAAVSAASLKLDGDAARGAQVVLDALRAPLSQIAENCGEAAGPVLDKVLSQPGNYGYNGFDQSYGDLVEAGVIDPTKVTRCALENAASVATMLLTTEAVVGSGAD